MSEMKAKLILLLFAVFGTSAFTQTNNSDYDETLAKKLGADEYSTKKLPILYI